MSKPIKKLNFYIKIILKFSNNVQVYFRPFIKNFRPRKIELIKDEARELLQAIKGYENSLECPIEMQKKIEQIKTRIKKSYSDKLDGNLPYGMDENDWNKLMADWASELNQLEMKLEERNQKSKILYNRLNLIMAFCNQLPELFRLATPEIKREIVQTCVRTLTYNGETLQIELFPVFYKMKYWKNVKNGAGDGIRTHEYRNHNPRS